MRSSRKRPASLPQAHARQAAAGGWACVQTGGHCPTLSPLPAVVAAEELWQAELSQERQQPPQVQELRHACKIARDEVGRAQHQHFAHAPLGYVIKQVGGGTPKGHGCAIEMYWLHGQVAVLTLHMICHYSKLHTTINHFIHI